VALVSIITVVKDDAVGLVSTYSSLTEQKFQEWEMIIVAGVSKDLTLLTAKKLRSADGRVRLLQEKGRSIYGAMNEGLDAAKAEFVWFMNAGDCFAGPDALVNAFHEISTQSLGVVVGGYGIKGAEKDKRFQYSNRTLNSITFAFNRRAGCHQAMIFRTDSLRNEGCYDTTYTLASDFALVLKVIKNAGGQRVSEVYAIIEPGGLADQGIIEVHLQKHLIRKKMFHNPIVTIASIVWTISAQSKIIFRLFFLRNPRELSKESRNQ
jgi:glycosyltransferase involved in cell wall biosynthesis